MKKLFKNKVFISVLLIMVPVLVFGYLEKPVEMGIVLFAGFTCAVFINLDKFSSFRAGELEATLREAINEANATIDQLKNMTEPMMNYLLAHIARGDTVLGLNVADKELLYLRLKENIESFELQNEYTSKLLKEVEEKLIQTSLFEIEIAAEQASGDWKQAQPIRDLIFPKDTSQRKLFTISFLRNFFNEHPTLHNEKVEERLKQYERIFDAYAKQENLS